MQREVAVKICAEQFSDRFIREARAVAALNHANNCTLYDVGPSTGAQPFWRRDGKKLYFLAPDSTLMAVDVRPGRAVPFGTPKPLFGTGQDTGSGPHGVSADGQRFLIQSAVGKQEAPQTLTVVVNWEPGR